MIASQSAVRSRAEAVQVSRTFDWMILFTLFCAVLGGYHIHYMLTGGDCSGPTGKIDVCG
jgi:methane/ammonia monooxygenase subunit A